MSDLTPGPDHAEPDTQAGFLAKARKAVAGGLAGGVAAAGTAITGALADGVITSGEWWAAAGLTLGGFVIGFAAVYAAPKNAE